MATTSVGVGDLFKGGKTMPMGKNRGSKKKKNRGSKKQIGYHTLRA